jgi:hypothetical protein
MEAVRRIASTRLLQFVSQTMKRFGLSADRHGSVHMNVNRWFYGIPIQLAEKILKGVVDLQWRA